MSDIDRLASRLFSNRRLEVLASTASADTQTYIGIAESDSSNGRVMVKLDGMLTTDVLGDGSESSVELSCTVSVNEGDRVIITVYGGTLATPVVTGVVGEGDAQNERIDEAKTAAETAWDWADDAHDAALAAQESADDAASAAATAQESADNAATAASNAQDSADSAASAAASAQESADTAYTAATSAQTSATRANTAANDALAQLSNVEDVIGTVTWLAEHGTFVLTEDTEIDEDKTYYVRVMPVSGALVTSDGRSILTSAGDALVAAAQAHTDGWLYLPVGEPTVSGLPNYYELTVDEALGRFVASHLALTDAGLWVLRDDTSYKILLSAEGMSVIDPQGHTVSTFGESIEFDSSRPQYIGGEDAYIVYYDSDGDGSPDSIDIGGSKLTLGSGRTLSQVLEDVDSAMDGAFLAISSTNGQLFKNGSESTVLQVSVFPNSGDRIDTIAGVHERYGSASYIEWRWKHEDSGEWGTLVSTDSHLSMGGMWLTVTPDDVATKTTFEASLVVPE